LHLNEHQMKVISGRPTLALEQQFCIFHCIITLHLNEYQIFFSSTLALETTVVCIFQVVHCLPSCWPPFIAVW